jgi:hypothetical protein
MSQGVTGEQLAARIGFAEQWLRRARGQVAEGDVARGALTLVLAEAEVRHAMEIAGLPVRRRRPLAPIALAAVVAAAAAAAISVLTPAAMPATAAGPAIVQLDGGVGELLRLVVPPAAASAAQPRRAVAPLPVRPPAALRRPPVAAEALSPAVPVATGRPAGAAQAAAATSPAPADALLAPAAAPPPPVVVSNRELIELVLTAGSVLRADPMRR